MTDLLLCEAEHEQAELYAEPRPMPLPQREPWFDPVSFILGAVVMLFVLWGVAGWICDVDWGGLWHG